MQRKNNKNETIILVLYVRADKSIIFILKFTTIFIFATDAASCNNARVADFMILKKSLTTTKLTPTVNWII